LNKLKIHPDYYDFVKALNECRVEYLIVGAYSLAFHGFPRATGDIDFWIRPNTGNVKRFLAALEKFGFGEVDIVSDDILSGNIIQLGFPPVRIDIISKLTGLTSQEIWESRQSCNFEDQNVYYIGKAAFIKNKRALGRHKDLADLELLGEEP
jgi:hypothetical protein